MSEGHRVPAVSVTTAAYVVRTFYQAASQWGFPASVLSDNGAIYTASFRGDRGALSTELATRGIVFKHSRPYHPQTCGKIERFHQTMKKYLANQDPPASMAELQEQLDRFVDYYNDVRPHQGEEPQDAEVRLHEGRVKAGTVRHASAQCRRVPLHPVATRSTGTAR